jgi:uncharacterized protein YbaR (Trm112 family)
MELTKELIDEITMKLQGTKQVLRCPICKGRMSIVKEGYYVPSSNRNGINVEKYVPCVGLICNNCSHFAFFTLKDLGINIKK